MTSEDRRVLRRNIGMSIGLLLVYLGSEIVTAKVIGGDTGAFLYVTSHFILMPVVSLGVGLLILRGVWAARASGKVAIALAAPIVIPIAIVYIAFAGSLVMFRLLDIDFNR